MSESGPFIHHSIVRFIHTDPAGYVFFPRYFEMLQAVVEDWFTHALGVRYADFVLQRRLGLPTAHTECEFLLPCRLGEELQIALILEKVGRTSITVRFEGSVGGERRLNARSVLVVIEMKDGRPAPIDDDLRQRLEAYRRRAGPDAKDAGAAGRSS